jgi:alpha-tubulin suppressor-like RCC1 family protein
MRRSLALRRRLALAVSGALLLVMALVAVAPPAEASATVPGPPTKVSVTPGNQTATVKWSAPLHNGGRSITGYTVLASPGSRACTTTGATSCTLRSLINGTTYTVKVKAKNAKGFGPSAPAVAVKVGVPLAPTGVGVIAENGQATAGWTAPSNNGSAITRYTVLSIPGSETCTTSGAKFCTVQGLTNGTAYQFKVSATNARGTGADSSLSLSITPTAPPSFTGGVSVVGGLNSHCSVLTSGGVDCWGENQLGQLGDGSTVDSAGPIAVEGIGGSGTLAGVQSVVGSGGGYCALLTSGGVDCWGYDASGQLGDGQTTQSTTPVAVVGTGGTGTLAGVQQVVDDGSGSYCALLTSGGVDCWGFGGAGQLGDGTDAATSTPVAVVGVGGSGELAGVAKVVGGIGAGDYCAVLTSGGVDCWGYGYDGELGAGTFTTNGDAGSATPVAVEGVGGGSLAGVASVVSGELGYCALLTSGGVDCWGKGTSGQLGNAADADSAAPVAVVGVGDNGVLTGVTSVADGGSSSYCALLGSGGVACWGDDGSGQLGAGGPDNSPVPETVEGVGGGSLSGVASLVGVGSGGTNGGYCVVLTSGGVDCWGYGSDGELGNGTFTTAANSGSSEPVAVEAPDGSGALTGVQSVTATEAAGPGGECAVLATGGVDCWGFGYDGELGNGIRYTIGHPGSALPVPVEAA